MPSSQGNPVVGVFDAPDQAEQAAEDLRRARFEPEQIGLLAARGQPAASSTPSAEAGEDPRGEGAPSASGMLSAAAGAEDVVGTLSALGVEAASARYYQREYRAGRSILAVRAHGRADEAREIVRRQGGRDVESLGGGLARGDASEHDAERAGGGTGPAPRVTLRWEDVSPRYATLFGQRYGAGDATWEQYEPAYRFAWQMANDPRYRGRPWSAVRDAVREAWGSGDGLPWDAVEGAMGDVWEDVADDARSGLEGGEQTSVVKPFGGAADPAPWTPPDVARRATRRTG